MNTDLSSHARAGRMTAAMRAASLANVPKALRVAIVQGGSIVDERLFRERMRVTGLIDDAVLFDIARGAWVLCVPNGAIGHVVTRDGKMTAGPHASRIVLDESARGKIVVGRSTLLFQFVVPPPRPSRAQLPLTTRRAEIDWALTILVAFSFLLHFGFVGSTFSDWLDPVVEDESAVVGLIEMTTHAPVATVEEHDTQTTTASTSPRATPTNVQAPPHANASRDHASSDARAASLVREADAMKIGLLTAFTGATAVQGALDRSDIPLASLEEAARDARGAKATSGELTLSTGNDVTTPGVRDLTNLGETRVDVAHVATDRNVTGPKFDMTAISEPVGPTIVGIEGSIARLRPSFRACYTRRGLDLDPSMEGKMTIDIAIAPNGDVKDVTKVDGAGLSNAVEQCILERAHNGSFSAPGGSGAHARVPIIFRQQH